ncbi:MAG: ZIP family metal transporter [Candidatus Helarchaeota archaeon]|nr:ZIP family metal transporter [Candidatus Helarchaeota archaeon]
MLIILILIIFSTLLLSLLAFIGVFSISVNDEFLDKIVLLLVSLSAGALIGGGFLHLLPEAFEASANPDFTDIINHIILEEIGHDLGIDFFPLIFESLQHFTGVYILPHSHLDINIFIYAIVGFFAFFIIEKLLHWRHCHKGYCEVHEFAHMNLFGDGIHNFIDGLIIAASFMASIPLGIITTLAIASHELPQEIGDFGVLIHGGYQKRRALFLNFGVAVIVVIGGIIGYFIVSIIRPFFIFLLPFAAGGFVYIAATDLIPELKKEESMIKSALVFLVFFSGILLMWLVRVFFHA